MMEYFVLNADHSVRKVGVREWGRWFDNAERQVESTDIGEAWVSTVFHGMPAGRGGVFETMVFRGPLDNETAHYATWDGAVAGHATMVARVEAALTPAPL